MSRSRELFPSRMPTFNHVALSLPPDRLDAGGRKAIVDFYGEVFGWEELPTQTEDRKRLVLSAHTHEQFVFLVAEDEPMAAPRRVAREADPVGHSPARNAARDVPRPRTSPASPSSSLLASDAPDSPNSSPDLPHGTLDHFGLSVGSLDELHAAHARAVAYRERDDRVDVVEPAVEDHRVLKIHNFYVGYLLPLMVEVQHWEFPSPG